MSGWRERLQETRETIERRLGYTVVPQERVSYLEESDWQRRMIQRDLDTLAWTALNYTGAGPAHELRPMERRRLVQKARIVWMKDPQAGAAVDLMNDFVFGRGLQKPKANDEDVQAVIDEFWEDPDNQLVLTSFQAQLALGTDLEIQSNLFLLVFEDGEDGKVKLGLLDHDTVETVVRDEDNRLRIMYYAARHFVARWDFVNDRPEILTEVPSQTVNGTPVKQENQPYMLPGQAPIKYYPHWRNVADALQDSEDGVRDAPQLAPQDKMGEGKVYHVALNRGSEMAFGHPRMDRLIRWFNAYNQFMDARVDIMAASAAFVMKRKVKGTPQQLERMANQALSRRSVLGMAGDPNVGAQWGPKAGAILTENDAVDHEPLNLTTNAPNAQQDAQMIRSQISAGTRWPASYYGDASQANLATATSLELPVLKTVEARQEVFESMVRFAIDRQIERAVDTGRIALQIDQPSKKPAKKKPERAQQPQLFEPGDLNAPGMTPIAAAYEDQGADEQDVERDLGYEFKMPSPLKRMLGDLVLAVMNIAKTFDPNNTNLELSRTLLTVALGELDLEDPAGAVERIFPAGYVDPLVSSQQGPPGGGAPAPGMPGSPDGQFSTDAMSGGMGGDAQNGYGGGFMGGNPYGAASASQSPEDAMREALDRNSDRIAQRAAQRSVELDRELDETIDEILSRGGVS